MKWRERSTTIPVWTSAERQRGPECVAPDLRGSFRAICRFAVTRGAHAGERPPGWGFRSFAAAGAQEPGGRSKRQITKSSVCQAVQRGLCRFPRHPAGDERPRRSAKAPGRKVYFSFKAWRFRGSLVYRAISSNQPGSSVQQICRPPQPLRSLAQQSDMFANPPVLTLDEGRVRLPMCVIDFKCCCEGSRG